MSTAEHVIEVRENHRFDADDLSHYLRGRIEGFEGPFGVQQFKGGQSNPTFLLTQASRRWVLRKKPPGKLLPSAHLVEREFTVLRALAKTDVPVPKVYHLCEDPDVIGTAFYVMEYVEGRIFSAPDLPGVSRLERTRMYESMADTLGAMHSVDIASVGLGDFGKPNGYVRRQIERWSRQYRASETKSLEAMEALMSWLPAHIPEGEEISIAHGDFRPGNLVFHPTEPRVIAVLDWELATLGHPMGDLGYFLMAYHLPNFGKELPGLLGLELEDLGIPSKASFVQRYATKAAREAPPDLDFYIGFALFRLAAIAQGVYSRALQGNASDARAHRFEQAAELLSQLALQIVDPV